MTYIKKVFRKKKKMVEEEDIQSLFTDLLLWEPICK